MLKLSIIVPLYNSEKYLPKCLDSLLRQDIPEQDYELILVDDGSPDDSRRIAEEYALRHSNIVVLTQPNKGTSGARNTGIRRAGGKYLCFVDPDDFVLEKSFSALLQRMEEENLDVLRFGYSEVDEQYQPTTSCKIPESPDYSSRVMDGCTFMAERLGIACYVWTFLYRTALLKENDLFFYEGDYFDDTPWLPRVLSLADRVDSMDFKRYFYLIRMNSLVQSASTRSIVRKIEGYRFLVKELLRQKRALGNEEASKWYDRMVSHCVLSLLTLVGQADFENKNGYLHELRENGVFPLSKDKCSVTNKMKLSLINMNPSMYCQMIHLKSRIR
jgi:glycosyltransferase involved in cell wall biosynthesis